MPSKWSEFLSYAEFWYNTKFHLATEMTPFEALYGYKSISNNPLMVGDTTIEVVDYTIRTREEIATILHKNLRKAQERMQLYANKNRTNKEFAVGDWVYLKLHPFTQQSIPNSAFHKLVARFYGPYRIVERVGKVAYKLDLLAQARIHNAFHISLLKRHPGDCPVSTVLPSFHSTDQ